MPSLKYNIQKLRFALNSGVLCNADLMCSYTIKHNTWAHLQAIAGSIFGSNIPYVVNNSRCEQSCSLRRCFLRKMQFAVLMNNEMRLARRRSCRQEKRARSWPCGAPTDALSSPFPSSSCFPFSLWMYCHLGRAAVVKASQTICLTLLDFPHGFCVRGEVCCELASTAQLDRRGLMNTHIARPCVCVCERSLPHTSAGFKVTLWRDAQREFTHSHTRLQPPKKRRQSMQSHQENVWFCTLNMHTHPNLSFPCALTNKPQHPRQWNATANTPALPSSCFIKNWFVLLRNSAATSIWIWLSNSLSDWKDTFHYDTDLYLWVDSHLQSHPS